ncbi:MAG: hypothetical protein MUC47_10130 [Candidatus Kapabacteria bacterium]|nr:hypothetical protein [Candidatus Kapabacteria bacterium]
MHIIKDQDQVLIEFCELINYLGKDGIHVYWWRLKNCFNMFQQSGAHQPNGIYDV